MIIAVYGLITAVLWMTLIISLNKDRSRYRNCYLLFGALIFSIFTLTFVAGNSQNKVIGIIVLTTSILLLIVPFFLVINGILMLKREGCRLQNVLSLALGIVVGIGEIATFLATLMPGIVGQKWDGANYLFHISRLSLLIGVTVTYISMSFVIFMIYCIFLQIIPRKKDFDYVIIHGAGLRADGTVTKLLADRLDKAIEVYKKDPTPPKLIPLGGKGDDELISEAQAMETYLLEKGIPANMIIKEDKSTTTYENIKNSKEIIDKQQGEKYTVLVTSNYHVYRALRYCRKIGLKCTGVGSHVAFYYWPSAMIREYIAIHSEKKHLIIFLGGWIMSMFFPAVFYYLY